MAVYSNDKRIRIFNLITGKIIQTIDETPETNLRRQTDQGDPHYLMLHLE